MRIRVVACEPSAKDDVGFMGLTSIHVDRLVKREERGIRSDGRIRRRVGVSDRYLR